MKVSIREGKNGYGLTTLNAYRSRERKFALPGSAQATVSGYWIVIVPGQSPDVVDCMADAAFALQEYYSGKES